MRREGEGGREGVTEKEIKEYNNNNLSLFLSLLLPPPLSLPSPLSPLLPSSDGKGGYFYHNFATGQSTWEHPCDQFYLKMLDQEREKQAFRAAAETNVRPSTSHGRQSSGAAVARVPGMGTKNAPALGPVKPQVCINVLYMYT